MASNILEIIKLILDIGAIALNVIDIAIQVYVKVRDELMKQYATEEQASPSVA